MARPVEIRKSYAADAGLFARFIEAIGKDPRQSDDWKNEVQKHLRALVDLFLRARMEKQKR